MRALQIVGNTLGPVELNDADTLTSMQGIVGGYIERAASAPSPEGRGRTIDVWVDDEGLLKGRQHQSLTGVREPWVNIFAGDIVITASSRSGNTVAMTDAEVAAVTLSAPEWIDSPHTGRHRVPILSITGQPAERFEQKATGRKDRPKHGA